MSDKVVYLVPCTEKHKSSQISYSRKAHGDLVKISNRNVCSIDTPMSTLKDSDILIKLESKTIGSLETNKLSKVCDLNNSSKSMFSSKKSGAHPPSMTNKASDWQNQSMPVIECRGPVNEAINTVNASLMQQSNHNGNVNTHALCFLPSENSKIAPTNLENVPLSHSLEHKDCQRTLIKDERDGTTIEDHLISCTGNSSSHESQQLTCTPPHCDAPSQCASFNNQSIGTDGHTQASMSSVSNNFVQNKVHAKTPVVHRSSSDIICSPHLPKASVVNESENCKDDSLPDDNPFLEGFSMQSFYPDNSSSDCEDMSFKDCVQSPTTFMEMPSDSLVKPQESDGSAEVSGLENLLNSGNVKGSAVVNKGHDQLHYSSGFEQQYTGTKISSEHNELSNINDIISDVGDILDDFCSSSSNIPATHMGNDSGNVGFSVSELKTDTSAKHHSDFNSSAGNTWDCSIESLFQPPHQSIPTTRESSAAHISNQDSNYNSIGNSSRSFESDLFSDLIMPGEGQSNVCNVSKPKVSATSKNYFNKGSSSEMSKISTCSAIQVKPNPPKSNLDIVGIPKRVAFKVRPAGKPIKGFEKLRMTDKHFQNLPRSLRYSLGNEKRVNDFSSQLMNEKGSRNGQEMHIKSKCKMHIPNRNLNLDDVMFYKHSAQVNTIETSVPDNRVNACLEQQVENLTLPVGKTGLRITIPNTAKTNVISFLPTVNQVCKASVKPISAVLSYTPSNFGAELSSTTPNISFNSCSPSTNLSVLRRIRPDIRNPNLVTASTVDSKIPEKFNPFVQETVKITNPGVAFPVAPTSVISFPNRVQAMYHVSVPQTTSCKPLYMMVPATNFAQGRGIASSGLPKTSIVTHVDTPKTKASNTLQLLGINSKELQTMSKQYGKSYIHPIAPKIIPLKNIIAANECIDLINNKLPEPIKITIRTKPRVIAKAGTSAGGLISTDDTAEKHPSNLNVKLCPSSLQKTSRNKNLGNDLKSYFPNVPEAILQQLTIPPQALHRGYMTTHDLQNIHTQALKLHLSIIYRNHVSKCTTYKCEICHNFVVQQDTLRWNAREKPFKPKVLGRNNNKNVKGRFKSKKPGKKCIRSRVIGGEDDDPTYEPPLSYINTWKRKVNSFWYNREPTKISKEESNHTATKNPQCCVLLNDLWQTGRDTSDDIILRRSTSEPNINHSGNQLPAELKAYSCDDSVIANAIPEKSHSQSKNAAELPLSVSAGTTSKRENEIEERYKRSNEDYEVPMLSLSPTGKLPSHMQVGKDIDDYISVEQWQRSSKNPVFFDAERRNKDYPSNSDATTLIHSTTFAATSCTESRTTLQPVTINSAQHFPPTIYLEKGCSCSESCRRMQCPCARAGVLCRSGITCLCKSCDNPLNILHQFKLDVHIARVDECLMQNLYSYNVTDLCKMLLSAIVLPCCRTTLKLQHIIPSTVICNCCGSAVSYSWCAHNIHLQTVSPRNHCLVCCSCKPALHTHCQRCRQCTPSVNQGTCVKCGNAKLFVV